MDGGASVGRCAICVKHCYILKAISLCSELVLGVLDTVTLWLVPTQSAIKKILDHSTKIAFGKLCNFNNFLSLI